MKILLLLESGNKGNVMCISKNNFLLSTSFTGNGRKRKISKDIYNKKKSTYTKVEAWWLMIFLRSNMMHIITLPLWNCMGKDIILLYLMMQQWCNNYLYVCNSLLHEKTLEGTLVLSLKIYWINVLDKCPTVCQNRSLKTYRVRTIFFCLLTFQ